MPQICLKVQQMIELWTLKTEKLWIHFLKIWQGCILEHYKAEKESDKTHKQTLNCCVYRPICITRHKIAQNLDIFNEKNRKSSK